MANEGHILIKRGRPKMKVEGQGRDYRKAFFHPKLDRDKHGHYYARPWFTRCEKDIEDLQDAVKRDEEALTFNFASSPQVRETIAANLSRNKDRLDKIEESKANAEKELSEHGAEWKQRREDLKALIRELNPSRKDIKERRITPGIVAKRQQETVPVKDLSTGEDMTFDDAKKEFIVLSRILGEESYIGALDKD
jgi:hypothetical protein